MSGTKFELLNRDYPEDNTRKQIDLEDIKALRTEARGLRDANNRLVKEVWNIDRELRKAHSEEEKNTLLDAKMKLSKEIKDGDYAQKIKDLVNKIQEYEITLYGHSDINNGKPYRL